MRARPRRPACPSRSVRVPLQRRTRLMPLRWSLLPGVEEYQAQLKASLGNWGGGGRRRARCAWLVLCLVEVGEAGAAGGLRGPGQLCVLRSWFICG